MAITLHPDAELESALTALAEAEGTTKQEVVRRAVLDRYARTVHVAAVDDWRHGGPPPGYASTDADANCEDHHARTGCRGLHSWRVTRRRHRRPAAGANGIRCRRAMMAP
jgi:hypothetical protein